MKQLINGIITVGAVALLSGCNATSHSSQTGNYGEYFSGDGGELVVTPLLKTQQSWNGDTLPAYPDTPAEISVIKVTIPAHSKVDWHQHPVINAAVILKGQLKVYSEDKKSLQLKAGDAFAELVNTWHTGVNEHDEPVELVVFYAGTPNSSTTIFKP